MKRTILHALSGRYYHGEIIENKNTYWVMRVTHSALSLEDSDLILYKDAQYPDGIRTFYKDFGNYMIPL